MTDLLTRIQAHVRQMAPHPCEREAGKLLIEAAGVLANTCECLESNKAVEAALEGVVYAGTYADGVRALRDRLKQAQSVRDNCVLVPCDKLKEMQDNLLLAQHEITMLDLLGEAAFGLEAERDDLRAKLIVTEHHVVRLQERARAVVERWDGPKWKDLPHTAVFIHALRDVIDL